MKLPLGLVVALTSSACATPWSLNHQNHDASAQISEHVTDLSKSFNIDAQNIINEWAADVATLSGRLVSVQSKDGAPASDPLEGLNISKTASGGKAPASIWNTSNKLQAELQYIRTRSEDIAKNSQCIEDTSAPDILTPFGTRTTAPYSPAKSAELRNEATASYEALTTVLGNPSAGGGGFLSRVAGFFGSGGLLGGAGTLAAGLVALWQKRKRTVVTDGLVQSMDTALHDLDEKSRDGGEPAVKGLDSGAIRALRDRLEQKMKEEQSYLNIGTDVAESRDRARKKGRSNDKGK